MSVRDRERGMVLFAVLWAIAFCSVLVMATSMTFRSLAGIVAIDRDRVQADVLLSAGLEVAAGMSAALKDAPLTARSTVVTLPTGEVRVSVGDETGRIDIGRAPADVLASLLRHVGADDNEADALAKAIVALRDEDHAAPPADGAQRQRSVADKKPEQPTAPQAQSSFSDIRQLAAVPGIPLEWITAMAPLITVYGSEAVNPLTAPVAVIRALPFFEEARMESFLAMRGTLLVDGERLGFLLGRTQQYLKVQQRSVISVDLAARTTDGYSVKARAFIVLLKGDKQPYRVLAWNPGGRRVVRDAAMVSGDTDGP
ncbi:MULTISPECIES: type II secretion system protein GspK [unclassified Bradyrhizobium]|uniref:general secretion pathway protein GspK n=1 Tax=unclassified Bradyrhizobium TaxID=2631580 RepID=UPI0028EC0EB5|nr:MULTISPECIES: type II secretion system protein GspK [unclassified Bradyrhizobium]